MRLSGIKTLLIFLALFSLSGICRGEENLWIPSYDAGVFDPVAGPVHVRYRILKDAEQVEVLVEDFRGQVVDRLVFLDLRAGHHEFAWSGLDDNRQRLPDGRYWFSIRVRFMDGTAQDERIEFRIVTFPEEEALPAPEPLPPGKYSYAIDGSLSTFYRRNTEDPEHRDEDGEQRVRVHLALEGEDRRADAVFSMRRAYSSEALYDSSQAMMEQRWKDGKFIGIFRRSLGNLTDPMRLFSDFRTDRKKVGARVDQSYGWMGMSAMGFRTEGNVDNRQKGLAGRLTFGPPQGWKLGLSYTRRQGLTTDYFSEGTSSAFAGDVLFPLFGKVDLVMEYAATQDTGGQRDCGCVLRLDHRSGGLRVSGGYFDLGENFSAPLSDPVRQINSDARGGELNFDYMRTEPLWRLRNFSLSMRLLAFRRHISGENIREADGSMRFGLGDRDTFFFNWFERDEGGGRTLNLVWSGRRAWSASWSSGLQGSLTKTGTGESWRWMLDTAMNSDDLFMRVSLERLRSVTDDAVDSPFEESSVHFDIHRGPWKGNLTGSYIRQGTESGINMFARLEYLTEFLHRYRLITYLALGNRAALETEKQIEMGVEFWL